jgi:hypothetical protein
MMGGAGCMLDMVIKVKQNLSMLPSNQPKFKESRRAQYTYKTGSKLQFKEVSQKELEEVICKIRLEAKKERKRQILVSVLVLIITLFVFGLFLWWFLSRWT